ncbi:MAG TPA: lipopolysaccharide transport periplasmic protein LptA [Geobacteraceae bacterium]|nr:lipopolysaccharide transport periplasmic protein LptA [Geobacteraceae bacterium]
MKKIIFSLLLLFLLYGDAFCASGAGGKDNSSQPINIKSNELYTDSNARTATFVGKVVAKQNDVTIFCDKMIIYYPEQGGQVEKVEAFGNVRIVQLNRLGTGGHAVYENKEGKITLYQDPKVYQDKNVVSGNVITYYLDEEKSVVTSGPGKRVEATIYPKSRENNGESGPKKNP